MNFESIVLCSEYNWDEEKNKESLDLKVLNSDVRLAFDCSKDQERAPIGN